MYWRLAGTFLVALAVYLVSGFLLLVGVLVPTLVPFEDQFLEVPAASPLVPAALPDYLNVAIVMFDLCAIASTGLAYLVWGFSWPHSRANPRAWLVGIRAFTVLAVLMVSTLALAGLWGVVLAVRVLFAAATGAVAGFALGRALANRFVAGRGLQRGPVPAP